MEASFVDIGLDKNGFLYVDEIVVPELEGKRHGRRIQELIQRGEEVLVQAVKDPMGTKGARLTTEISLPGRFLVYVPYGEGIGISRRLDDDERERLKAISKELELPEGGIIVRTAAEGASRRSSRATSRSCASSGPRSKAAADRAKAPALVYQEAELPLRIVRDLFIRDFERVVVDHERTYRRIVGYLQRTSPELAGARRALRGREPLMEAVGVEAAVRSTLDRRVDLPSGGYLIFDYAEAFTVVDVNTGRFVGSRGRSSGARLEDTITKNNLEAVEEVVRQLRLRDIGGIIVIDFIDMANPKNRQLGRGRALKRELERDRTKTYVVEISPLGLVEMTRQNVTDGPREILTIACPTCSGDGIVVSDETLPSTPSGELRALAATSRHQAFLVELNAHGRGDPDRPGGARLGRDRGRDRAPVLPRDEGRPPRPLRGARARAGLEDRAEVAARRGRATSSTCSSRTRTCIPRDAVARLNGYAIAVAGAASRVGKTVKVRIERVDAQSRLRRPRRRRARAARRARDGTELDREDEALEPKKRSRAAAAGGRAASPPAEEAPRANRAGEAERREAADAARRNGRRGTAGEAEAQAAAEAPEAAAAARRSAAAATAGAGRGRRRSGGRSPRLRRAPSRSPRRMRRR